MQWPHKAGHSSLVFVLTRGADLSSKLRCAVGGFKQQPGGLILRTMEALLILASIVAQCLFRLVYDVFTLKVHRVKETICDRHGAIIRRIGIL